MNPSDSLSWIELGLRVEADGHAAAAEQYFLRAAEVDKEYLPKWTLANYYFRRDDEPRFWFWTKAAVQMLYGDPAPLFRLSGKVLEDGNLIDRLAIHRPDTQASYLSYLLSQNRLDLSGPATRRLLAQNRETDVPLLLGACDRLIDAKLADEALAVWNGLAQCKANSLCSFLARRGEDFERRQLLANPRIAGLCLAPTHGRWDQRLARGESPGPAPHVLRRSTRNLRAPRSVFAGAGKHRVRVHRLVSHRRDTTGHRPRLARDGYGWRQHFRSAGESGFRKTAQSIVRFTTPAGCRLIRIALAYRRALGTTRIEGAIVLQEAGMRRSAQLPE